MVSRDVIGQSGRRISGSTYEMVLIQSCLFWVWKDILTAFHMVFCRFVHAKLLVEICCFSK